jgi:hypothetical protein
MRFCKGHVICYNHDEVSELFFHMLNPFKKNVRAIVHYINEKHYDHNPYHNELSLRGRLCDNTYLYTEWDYKAIGDIMYEIENFGLWELIRMITRNASENNINAWIFGETTLANIPDTLPECTWRFVYIHFKISGFSFINIRNYSDEIIRMQKIIFDNKMMFIWAIQNDIYPTTSWDIIYYMGMKFLTYIHLKKLIERQFDINELRQTMNDSVIRDQLSLLILNFASLDLLFNSNEINAFELFVSKLDGATSNTLEYLHKIYLKFKNYIDYLSTLTKSHK